MEALVLCTTDPSGDPRPQRMIELLKELGYTVTTLLPRPPVRRWSKMRTALGMISPLRLGAIRRRFGYPEITRAYDVVIVEDIYLLPLAFEAPGNPKVLLDAREYYPRINEESAVFRLFQRPELVWLCRTYMPRCHIVVTVSNGLATAFEREFGIKTVVVRSVPRKHEIAPHPSSRQPVRMVHHGIANRNRRLENLLAIAGQLGDRYTLDLYLTGDPAYVGTLRDAAPANVDILAPVPFEMIVPTLSRYDLGLFYVEPTTFNLLHCLPNKLFEFIQARLAVAIGPSPDMAEEIRTHGCGVVAPEFSITSMVATIRALTGEDIAVMKAASHLAADELCWEQEKRRILQALAA